MSQPYPPDRPHDGDSTAVPPPPAGFSPVPPRQPFGAPQPAETAYPYGPGQPAPTGPGHPGFGPPAPAPGGPHPKKSPAFMIVAIVVAVLLALCGGAVAVIWWAADKVPTGPADRRNAAATTAPPTTAPSASPSAAPSPSPLPTVVVSLREPGRLGGLPRLSDSTTKEVIREIRTELKRMPGAKDTVAAFYGSRAKKNVIMVTGATLPSPDPQETLDAFAAGMGDGVTINEVVDAGPLGGVARCGGGTSDGLKMGVCAWADHGSVGLIAMYFKGAADLKPQFLKLRAEVEQQR